MSANNWAICPRCAKRDMEIADQEVRLTEEARDEAYGKVSRERFIELDQLVRKAQSFRQEKINNPHRTGLQTLREDWLIGIFPEAPSAASLYIKYHGRCDQCYLDIKFQHMETVS